MGDLLRGKFPACCPARVKSALKQNGRDRCIGKRQWPRLAQFSAVSIERHAVATLNSDPMP